MSSIAFFYEDTDFRLSTSPRTRAWIRKVIKAENQRLGQLNYIFCSDEFLLEINRQYLHHDTLTDIVTFDNSEQKGLIEGDIFISVDRVTENADKFKVTFREELHRVIVHGALHLIGYQDKSPSQKAEMRKKEDSYLSLHKF
jgi:rRNA maturation RNase YbeY